MPQLLYAVVLAVVLGVLLDLATASIARREALETSLGTRRASTPVDHHRTSWPAGRWVVPAVSAALASACATRLADPVTLLTVVPLVCLVTELAVIDLNTRRLPNLLTVPAIPLGAALVGVAALLGAAPGREALTTAAVAVAVAVAVAWWWPAALGMGDAKLICAMVVLVAPVGAAAVWLTALAGLVLSGVFSAVLVAIGRRGTVAAGPFLAAGAMLAVLLPAR